MSTPLPLGVRATLKALVIVCSATATLALGACATKEFAELAPLEPAKLRAMSCEEIEAEFVALQSHEQGVDEEATTGQAKQIFFGGMWSVIADEKLEAVARQKIRDRTRQLYEAKLNKKCS